MESTTLYFKQGSSDKIYQAQIEPSCDLFLVNFAFGRRGSTLSTGTKTSTAVKYDAAKAIFDKLIREKMAKGYTPGESGTPYQHTEKQTTGIHCQLLNSVEEDEVEQLITDSSWWMQEKHDGRRMLVQKQNGKLIGINRLGLAVALPETLVSDIQNCSIDFTLDGEVIGDMLYVFDVLSIGDDDLREQPYLNRHVRLMNLSGSFHHPNIHLVETACIPAEKRDLFKRLKAEGREGVVFKSITAPYTAGRPNNGGTQLKLKFCETASFIVGKVNAKRSVGLLLNNGSKLVDAGNVTIPPNREIPKPDDVVECRYLYAFRESGCIFQPVFLGTRDDMAATECTVSQLKYKST